MPSIDPSLLSAYIDDELDLIHRTLVEQALRENPRLARDLQRIRDVRACLQQLPPAEAPPHLASELIPRLGEIQQLVHQRAAQRKTARRALIALGPLSAIAAALLVAWGFHIFAPPHRAHLAGAPDVPPRAADGVALIPEPAPAPPEDIAGSGSNPATQPAPAATAAPDRELVAAIDQQDLLRSLLGQPGVRRLLISVDAMDNSLARVEESLRIVPRAVPEQARIRIAQGIAIDPQNPDDAVVYAVVFDEAELANFRKSLADALPSAIIDDQAAPPSLLALLAESPEFDFSSVDARGTILPPRPGSIATELARRVMSPFEHILPAFAEPDPSLPIPPFPIAGESSSLRSAGPIPKTIEAAFLRRPVVPDAVRSRETVYLVWLTQRA